MDITIRHTQDCPNLAKADGRVLEALRAAGKESTPVRHELVATGQDAERLGFTGSPTILVNGRDPFADPRAPAALACRVYQTPDGPDGAPGVAELRAALGEG